MDEGMINQALSVLHSGFGSRLAVDMLKGEVAMRHALMEQLQMDESTADKVVKQLAQTGWIEFPQRGRPDPRRRHGAYRRNRRRAPGRRARRDRRLERRAGDDRQSGHRRQGARRAAYCRGGADRYAERQHRRGGRRGAYVGAAAAGLAGARTLGDPTGSEGPDPDRDENQVSSAEATAGPPTSRVTGPLPRRGATPPPPPV